MRINYLIFCFFSILLIGCIPKYEKVEKIDNSKIFEELKIVKSGETNKNYINWWESFNDKQLNFIIDKALTNSPSLKSIEQRFAKANTIIKAIESENLPNISFESSLSRERFSENHIFPAPLGGGYFTQYHTATTLDYKFDFWDERKSRILSAKNLAYAQKAFIENSKLNLSLAITEVYLSWNYNERKLDVIKEVLEILDEEYEIIKSKYDNGLIDERTLNDKKAQIFQMRLNQYSIKEIVKKELSTICILSGQLPSFSESLTKPLIEKPSEIAVQDNIYLNFLSQRADIAIQKYLVLSNDENINVAKTKFYPNINLSALLGFTSFVSNEFLTKSSSVPSAGVALDLPIFDWGKREANLDDKVIAYNSSVYEYNEVVNKAVNEVVTVLKRIDYKKLQLEMHHNQIKSIELNEEVANKRFKIGLTNKIPYFDSKINSLMTHMNELDLIESSEKLKLELIKATGGGFKEEDLNNATI